MKFSMFGVLFFILLCFGCEENQDTQEIIWPDRPDIASIYIGMEEQDMLEAMPPFQYMNGEGESYEWCCDGPVFDYWYRISIDSIFQVVERILIEERIVGDQYPNYAFVDLYDSQESVLAVMGQPNSQDIRGMWDGSEIVETGRWYTWRGENCFVSVGFEKYGPEGANAVHADYESGDSWPPSPYTNGVFVGMAEDLMLSAMGAQPHYVSIENVNYDPDRRSTYRWIKKDEGYGGKVVEILCQEGFVTLIP